MKPYLVVACVFWLVILAACTSQRSLTEVMDPESGKLTARHTAGTDSLFQRQEAAPTASVDVGPDGSLGVTATGTFGLGLTAGEGYHRRAISLLWIGAGLIVLGIAAFIAKKWLPIIPTTAGSYLVIAGLALITLAMLPQWVFIVLACGGALAVVLSVYMTYRDKKQIKAAETAAERSVA